MRFFGSALWFLAPGLRASVLAVTLALASWPQPVDASAGTRTSGTVRLFGVRYMDAHEFGRRFGLTQSWTVPLEQVRLTSRWTTLELTVHSVEAMLNGVRLFLSEPVVVSNGKLYLSRGDVDGLFTPILSPSTVPVTRRPKTIVIDAGHGGSDPGNQNRALKLNEETFTLDVARRLQRLLAAAGFKVIMTRTGDRTVSLEKRAEIANRANADLFISIHFNAFSDPGIAGAETYVMTPRLQHSTPQRERDRRMMTTRFDGNAHDRQNALLGYHVHRALVGELRTPDRGLKRFRYSVLRSVDCPAVLVEAAFLSNPREARAVTSASHRQRIAKAIASGVTRHVAVVERNLKSRRR
ncbi:N-acetylmuramoyl-L-alanine amidase [Opitutus terrae PB90-1]|uniref:N-acetylmuramoyl-L-alanine amidase n=1 Tax=Opitutus terrae (strain DSM 11246 / JCM 15787 / PB90-1) TaxID=452637 RepID=B1ZSM0_OPITP|nr:N-acetylmuramoyl-L-alanine amidase [Opitutus terrae PB90-1]